MRDTNLIRFSLYGFLKNLRFFEPFFLLFLRHKNLTFTEVGVLFAFREICINIMGIPSGGLADIYGRKRTLILSFVAYIASFIMLTIASTKPLLYFAIFLFSIGESFRTGTHKAMIFDYLRANGLLHDKTRVYGFTRSWSQLGSALSVLVGALLYYHLGSFDSIFLFSVIPYLISIWNLYCYPDWLDKETGPEQGSVSKEKHKIMRTLKNICIHL